MTAQKSNNLDAAQQALQDRQVPLAARLFDALLREHPQSVEARLGRARCAMLQSEPAIALAHLRQAASDAPDNAAIARSLGVTLLAVGSLDQAAIELQRARVLQPQEALTHLHLGQVRERMQQPLAAAMSYYRALLCAQARGHWLDRPSTPVHLQSAVLRAMDLVDRERRRALEALLEPLQQCHGAAPLKRVVKCLEGHLKTLVLRPTDALQKPRFLLFPDLPAPRFLELALFPWRERLEAATEIVRAEALAMLALDGALQPFLKFDSPEQVGRYLAGAQTAPAWDAFFFYRDGHRIDANHARCVQTSSVLESLPLVRIREHAPEICFSVLAPGTHILSHTGVTNIRVVVHLPLVVPADCAIEVGGEIHEWQEGRMMVFDDTYEHQAFNRSAERRVILLMDAWNPYLEAVEREALAALIAGIGDFNRG